MIPGTVSPTYEELMLDFLPRPIKSEDEFEAVQHQIDGKRQLTAEHINKLSAFFHLSHELFFEPLKVSPKS